MRILIPILGLVLTGCLSGAVYPDIGTMQATRNAVSNLEIQAIMAVLEHDTPNFVIVTKASLNPKNGEHTVTVIGGPDQSDAVEVCTVKYDRHGKQVGEVRCGANEE